MLLIVTQPVSVIARPLSSERLVRAVAERLGLGLLALAQGDLLLLRHRKLDRRKAGPFVGPVTERLGL